MSPRPAVALALILAAATAPLPAPAARGQDAPPVDNRFFPKEMEDAVAALKVEDPEDSFTLGLLALSRLRHRDGALEPMREGAFGPILEHGLATRLEHVASFSGEVLAALDPLRLSEELDKRAESEDDKGRLFNMAAMAEEVPWPKEGEKSGADPVETLLRVASRGNEAVRTRAMEALGEVASSRRRCPEKSREKALQALLANYGGTGKFDDLRNVCAVALGKVGSPKAVPALLNGLFRTDGKHGGFAALALSWIEDPSVFASLQAVAAPGGGEPMESFAKAYEATARADHIESLLNTVNAGGKDELREAAAIALGRLLPELPAPKEVAEGPGNGGKGKTEDSLRARAVAALFDRMVNDQKQRVQWACFHAVSRAGGPWLEESVLRVMRSPNPANIARGVHLAGDWKLKSASRLIGAGIFSVKDDMMRRRCGIEFWRIDDRDAIEEFKTRLRDSEGGVAFGRGCEALGSWRCKEAFEFALDLLRSRREGSPEQFAVEIALEKMTGHLFGPTAGIWEKWFKKNPEFFTHKQARIEREKWRGEFDKENQGFRQTKETEKAVQMGLEYLARHQHPDGRWDPQSCRERCDRQPSCSASTGARVQEDPVSRTGLCLLAFMGGGYSHEQGKYKTAIRRGLEYMMARQQACGDYLTNDLIGGYNRPIALQAYAEAYAVGQDARYRPYVVRGVDFLTQIQNTIGGWRYRVDVETSDSSVAAWMLFAMKAAQKSGVEVREIVYEGCRLLFERYSVRVPQKGPREDLVDVDPTYGFEVGGGKATYEFRTGYQDQAYAPTHATTALGLMSHVLLGFRRSHPFCIGSANHILAKQLPEFPKDGKFDKLGIRQEYPLYFLYYGTLAMHQMGGKYFRTWNELVRVLLPGSQKKTGCARGSWAGEGYDGIFGSLYTTATGVMALETYYRYAPVLQE